MTGVSGEPIKFYFDFISPFAYLGSGLQSICIGFLVPDKTAAANGQFVPHLHFISRDWHWLPIFIMPFAIIGTYISIKIWHELPAATKKYIAEVEEKRGLTTPGIPLN